MTAQLARTPRRRKEEDDKTAATLVDANAASRPVSRWIFVVASVRYNGS
jgi:hypothetical protein